MIITFNKTFTGGHVIRFDLCDERNTYIVSNYTETPGGFFSAKIDEDMMKSLYINLHEFFKRKGFNVCERDEIIAKHLKDKNESKEKK